MGTAWVGCLRVWGCVLEIWRVVVDGGREVNGVALGGFTICWKDVGVVYKSSVGARMVE